MSLVSRSSSTTRTVRGMGKTRGAYEIRTAPRVGTRAQEWLAPFSRAEPGLTRLCTHGPIPPCHRSSPCLRSTTIRQRTGGSLCPLRDPRLPRHNCWKGRGCVPVRDDRLASLGPPRQPRSARRPLPSGRHHMNVTKIIDAFGYVIYGALAVLAVWGAYNAILLYRSLTRKALRDPSELIDQVRELCRARQFDKAVNLCQTPPYWHSALAQLIAVALRNRDKGLAKIKQLVVTEFHSEVVAGMENRLGSVSTIVRMGPLLGLLGTVASMIAAFGRIGGSERVNPSALAQ